jgi:hypothetical protein
LRSAADNFLTAFKSRTPILLRVTLFFIRFTTTWAASDSWGQPVACGAPTHADEHSSRAETA